MYNPRRFEARYFYDTTPETEGAAPSVQMFDAQTPEQLFEGVVRYFGLPAASALTFQRAFITGEARQDLRSGTLQIKESLPDGEAQAPTLPTAAPQEAQAEAGASPSPADALHATLREALRLERVLYFALARIPESARQTTRLMNAEEYLRSQAELDAHNAVIAARMHEADVAHEALLAFLSDGDAAAPWGAEKLPRDVWFLADHKGTAHALRYDPEKREPLEVLTEAAWAAKYGPTEPGL